LGIFKHFGRDVVAAFRSLGRSADTRAIETLPWISGGPSGRQIDASDWRSLIPYFASVRVLAEQVSALPMQSFREDGNLSKKIPDGELIKSPSVIDRRVTWVRKAVISLASRGNAYGIITGFDVFGFATGIEWIPPNEVYVDDTSPTLPRYYWASTANGYHEIPRERVVHIPWFVEPGKVEGLSPISAFARSIGVGLHAQEYGASWFQNGGVPPATFKNTQKTVSTEQAEEITSRLVASLRSGRPLTYGADWEFNAIEISPEEAQFIQTMKMNATQIAAIYGVPPEWVGGETGGSLTYNSPEQNSLHVYTTVLLPWLTLIEDHLSALLPERQFVKFNPDGILRGDAKTRYETHEIGIRAGFLTIDEVREMENRAPLPKPVQPKPVQVPGDPSPTPSPDPAKPQPPNGANGRRLPPLLVGKQIR
jgi:HK97 family phage portal protein